MALRSESPGNGPRLGLVLGAGGIRGCAHAGVIEVMREAEIPIDLVVGASVGSMFGLALAAGLSTEYIARVAREGAPLDLFRFYAGRLRPGKSNPIARMLWDAGEGKTFADLELPFAVLGTDIATGKPAVIDRGPVLPAVQASIALPFIARAVNHEGNYYLDGGLLDTAPVGVARQMGADVVVAVCLGFNYMAPKMLRKRPWTRPVLERLGTQRRPVAGRMRDQIRFGCRLYASSYEPPLPGEDADIAIWPDFGGINPNSFFGARFCYEQGVKTAREVLPEIERVMAARTSAKG
jgi:NTE family protein